MKNRTMDLLKYQPFPALAESVRASAGVVIERWQSVVRRTLPTANELTTQQLRNDLPNILQMIADALEADEPKATKALMDEAVTHGEVRYDQNFNIGDVLIEYSLLRRLLCGGHGRGRHNRLPGVAALRAPPVRERAPGARRLR